MSRGTKKDARTPADLVGELLLQPRKLLPVTTPQALRKRPRHHAAAAGCVRYVRIAAAAGTSQLLLELLLRHLQLTDELHHLSLPPRIHLPQLILCAGNNGHR